jgi:CRP-like cAMP-binding protein
MACYIAHSDLYGALERRCEKVRKRRSTVLFRRGERAFGMFLVIRGTVTLDFGVDGSAALASICGPGTLVGLPATLSRTNYSMTATVMEDAEVGFLTPHDLISLVRQQPKLQQHLLAILSEKVANSIRLAKALRRKENLSELGLERV